MADRYWVGGTGTWNTASTANWSASSGGASGASVPTTADSVFFDQAGTYTVTMTGALACLDITVSAGTVTFATGTGPSLNIAGSMSLRAGTVWSSTGAITFSATTTGKTVTTNGTTLNCSTLFFNGAGGGWTLGSALTIGSSSVLDLTQGTLDTSSASSYSITGSRFNCNVGFTREIYLNASTVTLTSPSFAVDIQFAVASTFNAGTSTIVLTGQGPTINVSGIGAISGNVTFYNVSFTNTIATTRFISGNSSNTFNNLSFTGPASAGLSTLSIASRQTINGTLSTTGTAGNRRVLIASATYGISVDLVVNSTPSLTDADFRGIYVRGTSAPISGTRIGNRGECRNITFSTPKTVYWNLAGAQNWSANGWATTSTGAPSTDNFPLPQDTATFTNAGSVTGNISINVAAIPNVDMSGRTTAMTLALGTTTVYGNWTNGSGTSLTNAVTLTFSGGGTQTITSAGKTFPCPITVDTYGGTVQLADALNIGSQILTVTNGTFTTASYAITAGGITSNNSNVRTVNLGASTLTLSSVTTHVNFGATNLTFNAGTSSVNVNYNSSGTLNVFWGGVTWYNVTLNNSSSGSFVYTFSGAVNTVFNNLTIVNGIGAGFAVYAFSANQTINGTLTCAGASAVRRVFLRSDTVGTQRTLTAAAISATDCDFRDINLAGAASGASPTRAGDCGGNSGITFPAAKTVYWNLAGAQNWNATAWATSSGGAPAVNNFPLAQDTAVFDDTGSVTGTITIERAWNIGTFDASARTSAMTLSTSTNNPVVYGDWKFGTGVTSSSTTDTLVFSKNGTQTITSNGVQFGCNVTVNRPSAVVQLADALSLNSARTLTLTAGTFDAVTYNVTAGVFSSGAGTTTRMGSGTWTLSGTGTIWSVNVSATTTVIAGASTIVLSDTSTTARTFVGAGRYYNKLTIGGATGVSTLTITGDNSFGELASTKTVAHTIRFTAFATITVGKWAVTGTVGNVVTVNSNTAASAFTLSIAGPANTGIDYLSVQDCAVSASSPGEFYAGVNSTNVSNNTRVIFTATPAPRTLYWVGGTGNWSSTTKWSTSSGGASGAAIPTSLDAVNFDSASNATAYTATVSGVTLARCAAFTMAGPAAGNVTFAGTVGIAFHGNVSFAATGITRTYTGDMQWAGNSSYTFTTNGLALSSVTSIAGIGATWTLGSAYSNGSGFSFNYGAFSTSASNYAFSASSLNGSNTSVRSITFNASTVTPTSSGSVFILTSTINGSFSFASSTISLPGSANFAGGGQIYGTVSFTGTAPSSLTITGANTFNNLTFTGRTTVGITPVTFDSNQTINGTLTVSAGTASAFRTFLVSDTLGTTRTLTCAAVSATDADFRDITIAGAAAPASGTRLGDAKGNSGITFPAAKTVYWALAGGNNWGNTGAGSWSATSGGAAANTEFPLAQDTAYIPFATPTSGQTITVNANYNIGTIDMSNRNGSALVTLATGTTTPAIYGNWINGTGTTLNGPGRLTYAGRGAQTIRSEGKTFTQQTTINSLGGSVTLQDAWVTSSGTANLNPELLAGTFDANEYNVTNAGTGAYAAFSSTGTLSRTLAIGSGTWTFSGSGSQWAVSGSNITITGSGTISFPNASGKQFTGGGLSYSGITLNQGGAGLLTVLGNNTFKTITNTYSATGATSIALGTSTTTLTNPWTATGAVGNVLTISGTSAASPATLVYTGAGVAASTVDYLSISNIRAYPLVDEWYAGVNSTNGGTLGWYFVAAGGTVYAATINETGTGTDSILARAIFKGTISETGTGTDEIFGSLGGITYLGTIEELATGSDSVLARAIFRASLAESGTGTDTISARSAFGTAILESATIADTNLARLIARATLSETATGSDTESASLTAKGTITETATGTDAESAALSANSTLSETATITDADVGYISFPTVISETATGTDADSATLTAQSAISETATGTDIVSARAAFLSAVAESATITDLISAIKGYFVLILESATATDTIAASYTTLPSVSETATITDVDSATLTVSPSVSESATGTETVSSRYIAQPNIAETATGTETVSTQYSSNPSVAESATGTETVSPRYIAQTVITESASITDAVAARYIALPSIFESASGSDIIIGGLRFIGVIAESATGTETVAARYITNPNISESATGTDTDAAKLTAAGTISETATGTEAITTRATFNSSLSESAVAQELVQAFFVAAAQVSELATGTDQISALRALAAAVVETATLTDSVSARATFLGLLQETATAQDAVNAPGSTYNILMQELASAQDALTTTVVFPVSLSETATGTQTNSAAFIPLATITESATITDVASALQAFAASISETSAAADSVLVAPSIFNAIAVASATAIDNFNPAGSIYNVTVPESATLSDSVIGAFLWNLIDDSQPESWQNVLNAQSVNWSAINSSQTAGWGEVDSAQATSWDNADSAQAPGWQDVQTSQTGTWNAVDDSQSVNWQNVVNEQSGSWSDVNDSQTAGWNNAGNAQSGTWTNIDDDQDPDWVDIPTLN